jgi:hypothetical protein
VVVVQVLTQEEETQAQEVETLFLEVLQQPVVAVEPRGMEEQLPCQEVVAAERVKATLSLVLEIVLQLLPHKVTQAAPKVAVLVAITHQVVAVELEV